MPALTKKNSDKILGIIARLRENVKAEFPDNGTYRKGYEHALSRIEEDIKRKA